MANELEGLENFVIRTLFNILLYSNIILCLVFFFMAYHLVRCSEQFEPKDKNLKIRLNNIHNKVEYGSIILVLLSVGFLFNLVPIFLYFLLNSLPNSPFLEFIGPFWSLDDLYKTETSLKGVKTHYPKEQWLILTAACLSLLAFITSIIGLYLTIFRKVIIETKTRASAVFILFLGVSIFFGIPLMLRLIASQGVFLTL